VLEAADAVGSPRWDTTPGTGLVDRHLGIVHKKEWKRILNAAPFYRVQSYTPTADDAGRIPFTALSDTTTPNARKDFYRVLQVAFNNVALREVSPKDAYLAGVGSGNPYPFQYGIWYRDDAGLIVPGYANVQATAIHVNHTPTRVDLLTEDTSTVEFPDDYEDILVYEGAARVLAKGAAETGAAAELKAMAEEDRRDMTQGGPWVMQFPDIAAEWGGDVSI
jgi:hypothetical protein